MKTRRLLGTVALLAAMLACDTGIGLPGEEVRIAYTVIATVSVTPSSGSGSFTMEIAYLVARGEDRADSIQCYYVSPEGNTMAIGDFIPERPDPTNHSQGNNSLKFSVTEPGFYKAGCHTGENNSQETTTFTVIETATPTPELPSQPAATPTATLPATTLKGRIVFHYDSYQSSRASGGGELDWVTKWCIPEVTITPDGVVGGTCEFSGTSSHLSQSTITAHITGIAVQGGSFNFTYVVTEKGSNGWNLKPGENPSVPVWSNEAKWEISYTGGGNFTSATQASGTATFNFSCDSGADNLFWCNSQPREAFSGTIAWSFVPSP